MTRTLSLIFGGISLALVALLILILQQYETTTEKQASPRKGEASYNRLLAAQHLLERMGARTHNAPALLGKGQGIGKQDVIILPYRPIPLKQAELNWLTEWVAQGGHLITTGLDENTRSWNPSDAIAASREPSASSPVAASAPEGDFLQPETTDISTQDNLLSAFNMGVYTSEASSAYSTSTFRCCQNDADRQAIFNPKKSIWIDDEVWGEDIWEDPKALWINNSDDSASHLVSLPYSQGRISVASDLAWIENARTPERDGIAVKQHASLLWHLVQSQPHQKVWLITDESSPSLWFWLWNYGRYALGALAVLLALAAWRSWVRFGPVLPAEHARRRRLLEHIQASGWFHWQQGHWLTLLGAAQNATQERIKHRQPQWHDLPKDALFDKLATHCQLPREQIVQAFAPHAAPNAQLFSQLISTLDRIRKTL